MKTEQKLPRKHGMKVQLWNEQPKSVTEMRAAIAKFVEPMRKDCKVLYFLRVVGVAGKETEQT